jgi:hypothetical protein
MLAILAAYRKILNFCAHENIDENVCGFFYLLRRKRETCTILHLFQQCLNGMLEG